MERELRIADWQARRSIHKVCGFRFDECGDHERAFYPFRQVDYAELERISAGYRYAQLHEKEPYHDGTFGRWAEDRSLEFPFHYSDAVTIGVALTDVAPWDLFTTQRNASPITRRDQQ